MKDMPEDIILVLDLSLSMNKQITNFEPSKLTVMLDAVGQASRFVLSKTKNRIGIVGFFAFVVPLLPPTSDYNKIIKTLSIIEYTGEGSALGDAIIEATKILRTSKRKRKVVVVTDGELNVGSPLELALIYSNNMNTEICIITIGSLDKIPLRAKLKDLVQRGLVNWQHADSKNKLTKYLLECLEGH